MIIRASLLFLFAGALHAQEPQPVKRGQVPTPGPYLPGFDATHYHIALTLPDTGTFIKGETTIDVALTKPRRDTLRLDLSGLLVKSVRLNNRPATFKQKNGRIFIPIGRARDTIHVTVRYQGHPDDGLIIQKNVHGTRGAFADNWPDRARFWFPSIDHPSDKATVDFTVHAPRGWQVITTRTTAPIPTYLMVIGATRFVVRPISGITEYWAFPEDTANAAKVFARAGQIVDYFSSLIAPFPYERLAHVESSTIFGGMENATAIFYDQEAMSQGRLTESTVAHETAHQWFGDAVTEARWSDLWLSEGFATYFADLWIEHTDGSAAMRAKLAKEWDGYMKSSVVDLPVVDTLHVPNNDLLALLNANSYNKGGAVLHMLRGLLGDSAFLSGLRAYYSAHKHGNAVTGDLRAALEKASGVDLKQFFEQWIYSPGFPILKSQITTTRNAEGFLASIAIHQVQKPAWPTFVTPLDVQVGAVRQRVQLTGRDTTFTMQLWTNSTEVKLDPDGWLLHGVAKQ